MAFKSCRKIDPLFEAKNIWTFYSFYTNIFYSLLSVWAYTYTRFFSNKHTRRWWFMTIWNIYWTCVKVNFTCFFLTLPYMFCCVASVSFGREHVRACERSLNKFLDLDLIAIFVYIVSYIIYTIGINTMRMHHTNKTASVRNRRAK